MTGSFSVTSVTPTNGTTITDNTSPIIVTFGREINPTTLNNILVRNGDYFYYNGGYVYQVIAGIWVPNPNNGAQATFTPTTPYPANSQIRVVTQNAVKDLAGNNDSSFWVTTFTSANVADVTAPTVTSVTPVNDATGVGRDATIVLTFSESINPSTVTSTSVQVFAGATSIGISSFQFSADNRTVSFTPTAPAGETITIVATSDIKDLSGNSLVNFQSRYQTADEMPTNVPTVATMRPGNGATNVSPNSVITLFTSGNPLNPATVQNALHIAQNGILVAGTVQLSGNNQAIEFTPSSPFTYGAVVQVFLDVTAQDIYGNALQAFSGQFTVQENPASSTAPRLVAANPYNWAANIPLNVIPQLAFDKPLAPATVNSTNVRLYNSCIGWVPGTVSLVSGGDVAGGNNVVQFQPQNPLATCSSYYYLQSYNLTDVNDVAVPTQTNYFYVGTASDTGTPTVMSVAPPNGATGVGINGIVVVTFSKAINPISVTGSTIQIKDGSQAVVPSSISFDSTNTVVTITPQSPLAANAQMTVTINGITDATGSAIAPLTTQFTTGAVPDTAAPAVLGISPASGTTNVPTNTVVVIQFNEPMATSFINAGTFYLSDTQTGQNVPGTISFSADLTTATLVPSVPLSVGRQYNIYSNGARDLTGNSQPNYSASFTTAYAASTATPLVTGVDPTDGLTGVATNTVFKIQFNEPIQPTSIGQVSVTTGGQPIEVAPAFSNGNQLLSLTPSALLLPGTQYTISVTGVQDYAGHTMATAQTFTFTTGATIDVAQGSITAVNPSNGQRGVGDQCYADGVLQ